MSFPTTDIDLFLSSPTSNGEPTTGAGFNGRGMARFGQGDRAGAFGEFQAALGLRPDSPEVWKNSAIVRQTTGAAAEAVEHSSRALSFNPEYAEAWNNRARARQALGDVEGARADFDKALPCTQGRFLATVFHNRGTLRQAVGDLSGALADFDRALAV